MKRFFLQLLIFTIVPIILIWLVFQLAGGKSDALYLKFTSPKQSSLILGTSKAAQGLQPSVFNKVLDRQDIYNYAFTLSHSPYGPTYYNSIKRKINEKSKNGVFIITVDPFTISKEIGTTDLLSNFKEKDLAVGQIKNVTSSPNYEYLLYHWDFNYFNLIARNFNIFNLGLVHKDGWVETNVSDNTLRVKERTKRNLKEYYKKAKVLEYSELRFQYLEKTINFLRNYGTVYLVRLPVSKPILKLENSVIYDFDQKISFLSKKYRINYLNLTSHQETFGFLDGNHLDEISARTVSTIIAKWIKLIKEEENISR